MTLASLLLENEKDVAFVSEFNRRIVCALADDGARITLGMLPLGESDTDRCIELVQMMCGGNAFFLSRALMDSELCAFVAYAIASAASQAVRTGGMFWPPFSDRLKISLGDPGAREQLSGAFRSACRRLGVIEPNVSALNWNIVAPIMAQASLLYCWVDGLVAGMKTTLNLRPLPDLEDSVSLDGFASDLATHIHNQQNLCNILRTEVGGIVAHRLIASCIYGRFEMLPPHLVKPMREAFESKGGQVSLKSPYVAFDAVRGIFELVLPKQPGKLLKSSTCWLINGAQYSPQIERRLSEVEVGKGKRQVMLRHLECGYQDQVFELELGVSIPFRVFDQSTSRERRIDGTGHATLPPGEYTLVMRSDCTTDLAEYEEERNGYRILSDVGLRPGVEPLRLSHSGGECTLSPALKAGIYHSSDDASSATLEDGSRLHFGPCFGFLVYIPKDQHSGRLSIRITRRDGVVLENESELKSTDEGVYDYSRTVEDALALATLPLEPGIHPLRITVSTGVTAVSRALWYWKGLNSISHQTGFRCQTKPGNIRIGKCRGLEFRGNDIRISPNYRGPRVVVALTDDEETLSLPRPGVRAVCVDPSDGETTEMSAGESLIVRDDDPRVAGFESGGFESWTIRCNGREVCRLEPKRPHAQLGLRSLAATFGKSGTVDAVSTDGTLIRLFTFSAGLVAKRLTLEEDHGLGIEKWATALPSKDLGRVAVRVLEMGQSPDPVEEAMKVIFTEGYPEGDSEGGSDNEIALCKGVSVITRKLDATGNQEERLKVFIHVAPGLLARRFLMIEMLQAPLEAGEWQFLQCADGSTTSRLCIVATGSGAFEPGVSSWWHHLWRVSAKKSDDGNLGLYQALDERAVRHALGKISNLTTIKYPSAVYSHSASYLSTLAHKLVERRKAAGFSDPGAWWEMGAEELEIHASAKVTPVVRQFLLAANPGTLRRHWRGILGEQSDRAGLITESFKLFQRVRHAGGRVEYAKQIIPDGIHPFELFGSFENSPQIFGGGTGDFRRFDFKRFFSPVFSRVLEHEDRGMPCEENIPVLSARHLLSCVHALNRRARLLARASNEDSEHPLVFALQTLTVATGVVDGTIASLNGRIGYAPWCRVPSLDNQSHYSAPNAPDLPLLGSVQAEQLNGLVWAICVASRGTAHGMVTETSFEDMVRRLSHSSSHRNPINLALSFAPELFAYYTALLDFALYNPAAES